MGSSAFKADELPGVLRDKLDEAMALGVSFIVGEAHGACRRFQDYLWSRGYEDVVVGHARSIRYNAGGWRTLQYGDDLKERERGMIEACDSAVVIWVNNSGVIAKNLELLRRLGKFTYVYEMSTEEGTASFGPLDLGRRYSRERRLRARVRIGAERLDALLEEFIASNEEERRVEGEDPALIGYHLNKRILERGLEGEVGVMVESARCHLIRR